MLSHIPLEALQQGGHLVVFLVAIAETLPFIGSFVPGHTVIIFAGFLSKLGILNIGLVMFLAALGAIVGDIFGYLMGKKYGYNLFVKYGKYFFLEKDNLDKAKQVLENHTGKALIIGRFSPVSRAITPFLAGAGGVHINKFWFYNIVGGISWAVLSVLIGYVFGASYEAASAYIGKFIFIGLALGVVFLLAYRVINKRRHIFVRFHLYTLFINLAALVVFFKTLQDVFTSGSPLAELDVWVNRGMTGLWNPWLNEIMIAITDIISPVNIALLTLALIGFLAYKKKWHYALLSASALAAGFILETAIKEVVGRVRPENALLISDSASFPSGHATLSIIFFLLVLYTIGGYIKNFYLRELFGAFCMVIFLAVGASRVYLNVHWLTDVVGGFALGVFCLTFFILLFKIAESVLKTWRKARTEEIAEACK
jgi:membrane protein DedA with SNARE-associated domain/membrane-associated phospholipid phosphatase